ncbi:hypothetical protein DID74_02435 [Candidatus Marinamargulisbacteria bacterium SCGC AG-333-B06]|nr:hypothetical protein DID74_02435 [Candidatus Marinamargulisbacteria bacterium SCGC AG-333-B06]
MKYLNLIILLLVSCIFTSSLVAFNQISDSTRIQLNENYNYKHTLQSYTYLGLGTIGLGISALSNPAFLGVSLPLVGYGSYLTFLKSSPYLLIHKADQDLAMEPLITYAKYNRYKRSVFFLGSSLYTYLMMTNVIFKTELPEILSRSLPYVSFIPLTASITYLMRQSFLERALKGYQFRTVTPVNMLEQLSLFSHYYKKKNALKMITLGIIGSSIAIGTKHTHLLAITAPIVSFGFYDFCSPNSLRSSYKKINFVSEAVKDQNAKFELAIIAKQTKYKRLVMASFLAATSYFLATQTDDEYLIEHELKALRYVTGSLALFNFSVSWPIESIATTYSK